jgi:hypothetical protein
MLGKEKQREAWWAMPEVERGVSAFQVLLKLMITHGKGRTR